MVEQLNHIAGLWWDWSVAMFWQVGLLILVIASIDRLVRRWAWPQLRYALWSLILIKLLLPPSLSLPSGILPGLQPVVGQVLGRLDLDKPEAEPISGCGLQIADLSGTAHLLSEPVYQYPGRPDDAALEVRAANGMPSANPQSAIANPQLEWPFYAMATWLFGTSILGIWLFTRLHSLRGRHAYAAAAASLPRSFYNQMADCANRLGLRRVPQVVVTRRLSNPAVFGIIRPVLLMPKGYLSKLSRRDTEHMLLHELAHIKRGDLAMHSLYMLLQIAYWYNPLLWLVRRQVHHLRELSCDATVANLLREQTTAYRQTLLETARRRLATSAEPGLGLLGLFEDSNRLLVRLNWLTKPTWRYKTMKRATVVTIALLMFACVLPMAQAQETASSEETVDVTTEQENRLAQDIASLELRLQQLMAQQLELQKQLQTLAQRRNELKAQADKPKPKAPIAVTAHARPEVEAPPAPPAKVQADRARALEAAKRAQEEAKKAAARALKAKDKAKEQLKWAQHAQQWQQSEAMQKWQEEIGKWQNSDEMKQWRKQMEKWAQAQAQRSIRSSEAVDDTSSSNDEQPSVPDPMPVMPPMPIMPAMPPMPSPAPTPAPLPAPALQGQEPDIEAQVHDPQVSVHVPEIHVPSRHEVIPHEQFQHMEFQMQQLQEQMKMLGEQRQDMIDEQVHKFNEQVKAKQQEVQKRRTLLNEQRGKLLEQQGQLRKQASELPRGQNNEDLEEAVAVREFADSLPPERTLEILGEVGSLSVRGGDEPVARITATVKGRAETMEEAQAIVDQVKIEIGESSPQRLYVTITKPEKIQGQEQANVQVEFEVVVPRSARVKLSQSFGDIRLTDLDGSVKAASTMGSIRATGVSGQVALAANFGNIDFVASEALSAKVQANAQFGSIKSTLPVKVTKPGEFSMGSQASGVLGEGEGSVSLTTNMGSIRIGAQNAESVQAAR